MKDLIEALQIFLKYKDVRWPTHCEHDVLYIMDITVKEVSAEDRERLEVLGFIGDVDENGNIDEDGGFKSFRFGSA